MHIYTDESVRTLMLQPRHFRRLSTEVSLRLKTRLSCEMKKWMAEVVPDRKNVVYDFGDEKGN